LIGVNLHKSIGRKEKRVFIDTGDECKSGFLDVSLSGMVDTVMYKSRLYTKMRIWPGVSAQVFRNRAEIGRILRDLYMELSIRGRFPVQAGLVQKTVACKEEGIRTGILYLMS